MSRATTVVPDLSLGRDEAGWRIEVMGAEPAAFIVSRSYRRRLSELQRRPRGEKDEKAHIAAFVQRAERFIDGLAQRRKTMRRIGEYLITRQESFVATGRYEHLRPLTRSRMAKDLDMHESTVSRATMGKFVRLANGEVVPFDVFFKPALRVQKMIEEILEIENPSRPLSDEEIARRLAEKGVHVARRTVNKYRDRTKVLSSRARRPA
jgi:RNA polymerase sigma-54 factor